MATHILPAMSYYHDDESSFSQQQRQEDVLRRYLGPQEFASFQYQIPWRKVLSSEHHNEGVLRYLGATTASQYAKLRKLYSASPKEFWAWCRHAAQYNVDEWGEYPLHRASRHGSVVDVRTVLELYPSAITQPCRQLQNLPLHCAILSNNESVVYFLLTAYPAAMHAMNIQQGLPLHAAVLSCCSDRLVNILLQCYPGALAVPNLSHGQTPMHLIYQHSFFRRSHRNIQWWIDRVPREDNELLEQALHHPDAKGRLPAHICMAHEPTLTVRSLLFYSSLDALACTDAQGYTPLHVACRQSSSTPTLLDAIQAIVKAYPQATVMSDHDGNLPLHVALRHGAPEEVIAVLLRYHRPTFHGSRTKLWELAAMHHASVATLFLLLRSEPVIVSSFPR
uniref:Uncharacterized protein n=1 Tax=Amphora coffeiformis TaxID=265554 RepID=A0A7S3LGF9_9STRA|mmetsp:Transcript_12803/g.24615  ORF Transcript_12803/g.24615 Transcript_12803/m.24615 type:complete len:393 (+) Transcript_12803:160-1338(+)|eukprot:scaffold1904_cov184-Amphora_coffeaeformis.AAC.5